MTPAQRAEGRRTLFTAYAALLPLLVAAAGARTALDLPTNILVLGLVVVIVGFAATGVRPAGWAAAVSGAVWLDWFHTPPVGSLDIAGPEDLTVTLLLVVVGAVTTEMAVFAHRARDTAVTQAARLDGLVEAATLVAQRGQVDAVVAVVEVRLGELLGLDRATFVAQPPPRGAALLRRDGTVVRDGRPVAVQRHGLPTDTVTCLEVTGPRAVLGRIDLVAAAHVARPTRAARRLACLHADQVAAALVRVGVDAASP